jgi:hypothetical protein
LRSLRNRFLRVLARSFLRDKLRRLGKYSNAMYGTRFRLGGSCVLSIILVVGSLQANVYAQRAAKLSPKVMAVINGPVLELKDDDPPLLRLKKERFNAALNEAKARYDLYNRGLTRIQNLLMSVKDCSLLRQTFTTIPKRRLMLCSANWTSTLRRRPTFKNK